MKTFRELKEDLASGRPIKKPVSSNLLKQRAIENEKALKSGFMKLTPKERAKESKRLGEARKMYDGGRAAKTGWDCGDCGAEKNRSDQCRSCGSPARYHRDVQKEGYKEDFKRQEMEHELGHETQGIKNQIKRGIKKFRNSDTAKQIRKKKTTYGVVAKEAFPDLEEGKKPVVHFKGEDKLKTLKIKLNPKKKIGVKVTDIGPGGKEVVRKNTMQEEQMRIVEALASKYFSRDPESNSFNRTKSKETTVRVGQKRDKKTGKMVDVMGKSTAPQGFPQKKR